MVSGKHCPHHVILIKMHLKCSQAKRSHSRFVPSQSIYITKSPTGTVQQQTSAKKTPILRLVYISQMERMMRIELTQSAWKAEVLPLNYTRILIALIIYNIFVNLTIPFCKNEPSIFAKEKAIRIDGFERKHCFIGVVQYR